ncbi:MAG: Unknown protein [uncultured Sulfurovum sp.]|uniref:Uncharacterized protein n=1 Tax=uncultured Sulfurovum sp. TaxID=269237 RepID=A0A6S6THE2_9BACT|nr:MAG: Unknown protein [uncultured Sulfurovum sp.]
MKFKLILIVVLFGTSLNLSAKDGVAFMHPFGELRVYFKDWLVVCADKGEGECRMVNYVNNNTNIKTGFFADSRLTIIPARASKLALIDFFHRDAPSLIDSIRITVDRKKFSFAAVDYETPEHNKMMETYILHNQTQLNTIFEASKSARWLTFTYAYDENKHKKVRFSLRGFTKAWAFIEKQTKL